jgi:hypothetical protein
VDVVIVSFSSIPAKNGRKYDLWENKILAITLPVNNLTPSILESFEEIKIVCMTRLRFHYFFSTRGLIYNWDSQCKIQNRISFL